MPENGSASQFYTLRQQAQNGRRTLAANQQKLFLAKERRKRLAERQQSLSRVFDPQNEDQIALRRRLKALDDEAAKAITGLKGQIAIQEADLTAVLEQLTPIVDPRERLEALDDRYPILLLPLRLETRFKQIMRDNKQQHELWVRVYPDDCAVNTFEATLSETEVRNARIYWAHEWQAGGQEAARRAAWRNLVASHGSGRALYIVENYRPLNEVGPPEASEDSVILIIITTSSLTDPEQAALAAFWEAVWRAGGKIAAVSEARDALETAVGPDRTQHLIENYRPFNLSDPPPAGHDREDTAVQVITLVFADEETTDMKRQAWSQSPTVEILPDRLALLGYAGEKLVVEQVGNLIPSPLVIGPNPQAEEAEQIRQEGDDIVVSDEMAWMVDFDEAVQKGMGFRVPLSPETYNRGFDKLFILGVRLTSDETDGQARLEELLANHRASRAGLSLLPQGTPTNNTAESGAGYSPRDDADQSFAILTAGGAQFTLTDDAREKRDGQWLAEALGVSPSVFQRVSYANGSNVRDALAMNAALWPATAGYWMETMLSPVFSEEAVAFTRAFFTQLVSGRGMTPVIRIGKQPYGILPVTVYGRMRWPQQQSEGELTSNVYLNKLHDVLMGAYAVWGDLADQVSYVGKSGDPHQILLDVLGLHAASAEHYTRYAESLAQVINSLNLHGLGGLILKAIIAAGLLEQGVQILQDNGYDVAEQGRPDLLDKYFLKTPTKLSGDLIDDRPLSETEPIRPYTADGRNYIEWLVNAARTSLDALRRQQDFLENDTPTSLLYLTLRHALMLGYYDTSLRLYQRADLFDKAELLQRKREANFIHIAQQAKSSESRWQLLYQAQPQITGSAEEMLIGDYIATILSERSEAEELQRQIQALERVQNLPTAELERLFVEHLDTCAYRLDAWLQGLVHLQMGRMRQLQESREDEQNGGLYLGAYGWALDLKPEGKQLERVKLTDETLNDIFKPEQEPPLLRDSTNAGYIHAPSLNHAVTAAVLRNGYLSQATPDAAEPFAVNLSSERVRRAMAIIEGMYGGQSLGALLGYQFERGLHDRHDQAEVDAFIYKLRKAFPLRADHLAETKTDDTVSIEAIEARNVLDGVALVEHILESGQATYPFGKSNLPAGTNAQIAAINAEVQRLLDTHDAVADLGLAEGIHQVVQGNFDRAAATLEAFSSGKLPPIPDVAQTPRSGIGLTHRVGLHLESSLDHLTSPVTGLGMTPRAAAEPALNSWLAGLLPPPDQVGVLVRAVDKTGAASEWTVTQTNLGLQPLDLLYMVNPQTDGAMTALDDLIVNHIRSQHRPDAAITIAYTEPLAGMVSFFELGALLNHLRSLLLGTRPLTAADMTLPNETDEAALPPPVYRLERIVHIQSELAAPLNDLKLLQTELTPLLDDPATHQDDLVDNVDGRLHRFVTALAALGRYGLPETGFGVALAWKRNRYQALLQKVQELVDRWQGNLDRFDRLLAAYNALPAGTPEEERFTALQEIEAQVAIVLTDPLPATPAAYQTVVLGRRADFVTKRNAFNNILAVTGNDLAALLHLVENEQVDLLDFDFKRLELAQDRQEIVRFSQDMLTRINNLVTDVEKRVTAVTNHINDYNATADVNSRKKAITQAVETLLGEEFLFIPEFSLPPDAAAEFQKSFDERAALLDYLQNDQQVDFPVDEWLYGVSRVRDKMNRLENVIVLAETLAAADLPLHPIQLPFRENDSWLALPFPPDYQIDADRLLFTAHFAAPFVKTAVQCGLLLDEWTEVIPTKEETTGLTFHYDRPNTEPPQVMLLAVPPEINGRWQWADLVDTLHETLEMAKRRAVEPDQIDGTDYGRFLPATISAVTFQPITISLNLALNNNVYAVMESEADND
ncbi:MAG: hypothetical protein HF973_17350 [Chloroflexi bacterium]|nr:hypothetical protein [Chloroflexota bacterium]